MPLGFLILGAIVLVAALRNTHKQLGTLVASDFTGAGSFIYWVAAIAVIGGLGYIPSFRGPSQALLVLLAVVLLLSNKGFFPQLAAALGNAQSLQPTPAGGVQTAAYAGTGQGAAAPAGEPAAPAPIPIQVYGLSGAQGGSGGAAGALGAVGGIAKALGGIFGL